LRKFVAYSETSPDWRNPTALEEYYQGYTINNGMNYFDTVGNFVAWKNTKLWKTLGHKLDMNEWDDDNNYPHYFNAHYFPNDNKVCTRFFLTDSFIYDTKAHILFRLKSPLVFCKILFTILKTPSI
jgi:hypothetical protein